MVQPVNGVVAGTTTCTAALKQWNYTLHDKLVP